MGVGVHKRKEAGFAGLEAVLVIVVIAAIVGVGAYVVGSKHSAEKTLSSTNTSAGNAPAGTTAKIDQLTQQDAKTETAVDNSTDSSLQQDASSSNTAVSNVGGAYNEASY